VHGDGDEVRREQPGAERTTTGATTLCTMASGVEQSPQNVPHALVVTKRPPPIRPLIASLPPDSEAETAAAALKISAAPLPTASRVTPATASESCAAPGSDVRARDPTFFLLGERGGAGGRVASATVILAR